MSFQQALNTISAYHRLIRLDKPIGIFLLLWPTLCAVWVASNGNPPLKLLSIFILGTILMRSAGCALNDLIDQKFDKFVQRTCNRPLVKGEVTRYEAILIFIVLSFLSFLLVLMTNVVTILLSFSALMIVMIYPFMKRVSHLPQVVLSIAFAMGIPMAFAAQTNTIPAIAWLMFLMTTLWIVVYDTFYAMVDRPDDIQVGIRSTAVLWDKYDRIIIGILQTCVVLLFATFGALLHFKWVDYWGILFIALLFIYQQYLVRKRERKACFKAFLNNQWVGFVFFVDLVIHYLHPI